MKELFKRSVFGVYIGDGEIKWEVGMTLIDEIMRRKASGGVGCIVIGDFGEGEVRCPLCWFVASEHAKILFECAVGAFCLAVGLGVVGSREAECGVYDREQFSLKF